jgi:hypothetical protein
MNDMAGNFVNAFVQCWGCPIFDRLFRTISAAGAAIYDRMVVWAWVALAGFWAFYVLWAVWRNLADKDSKDWLYQEKMRPVFINSLLVCALLGMGVAFPKFLTTITFEPAAAVTTTYAEAVLNTDAASVAERVEYVPESMPDDGFFRPELRDKTVNLMKTTVTQFQNMIKLGIAVMENSFNFAALFRSVNLLGNLLKQILMFMMGAYLVFTFFQLFMRFCFYFIDVIVSLAKFAFFFPFMMALFVFKNSEAAKKDGGKDGWVGKMGAAFSPGLIKDVFNSISALAVAVITYTIVMVVVAKFFSSDAMSSNEIARRVLDGTIGPDALSDENLVNLTLMGCIVIGFLINYLTSKIPDIEKEIFEAFGVSQQKEMGEEVGKGVETAVKNMIDGAAAKINVLTGGTKDGKKDEKKDDKKDGKAEDKKTE